jgi:hypothetical protein
VKHNEGGYQLVVHFCTADDALVVQNIFYILILSQFVKPPSEITTLDFFLVIT